MKEFTKKLEQMFTNKIFLYVIVFLTIITVLGYITKKNYDSVLFLIAIGLIVRSFNKNMSLVLLISVFVTSVYNYVKSKTLENMSGNRMDDEDEDNEEEGFDDMGDIDDIDIDQYLEEGFEDGEDYDEVDDDYMKEDVDGFQSNFRGRDKKKLADYNKIKDTYNDLIGTIRTKTAQIKKMTSQLKRG